MFLPKNPFMISLILGVVYFIIVVIIFLAIQDKINKAREKGKEDGIRLGKQIEEEKTARYLSWLERSKTENEFLQKEINELHSSISNVTKDYQEKFDEEPQHIIKEIRCQEMPDKMKNGLVGHTIQTAMEKDLIFAFGINDDLAFANKYEEYFVIINDLAVRISSVFANFLEGLDFKNVETNDWDFFGNCRFVITKNHSEFGYNENGWFYLINPEIENDISNDELNQHIDYSDNSVKPEDNEKKKRSKKVEDKYVNPWGEKAGSYVNNGIKYCNKHHIPLDSKGRCMSCESPLYRNDVYKVNNPDIADDLPF